MEPYESFQVYTDWNFNVEFSPAPFALSHRYRTAMVLDDFVNGLQNQILEETRAEFKENRKAR